MICYSLQIVNFALQKKKINAMYEILPCNFKQKNEMSCITPQEYEKSPVIEMFTLISLFHCLTLIS